MGILRAAYEPVYNFFEGNELLIGIVGSNIVMWVSFWSINAVLLTIDVSGRPKWLHKFRVQPEQNDPIDKKKLRRALKTVCFNQFVLNPVMGVIMYALQHWRGCPFHPEDVPSWTQILLHFVAFVAVEEIVFYYSHRLLHHPLLYKHIHKKHHEWTAPIGIIAIYAHPIEYLLSNGATVLSGPLLVGSHTAVFWLWLGFAMFFTVSTHSGYHFPLMPSPEFHDFHHFKFNYCFGSLGILDRLHGTDGMFRESVNKKRHRLFMATTPMNQLIPAKSTDKQG